jgi:type VI secretion system protein ImpF
MAGQKLNPTLFDKLVGDTELSGLTSSQEASAIVTAEVDRASLRFYTVPNLERFNENALRATVRREVAWLLNTTHLEAVVDLSRFPEVKTSVLNYGVPDLAGKSMGQKAIRQRGRDIREALVNFEPRIDPRTLDVQPRAVGERENAVTYVIEADVAAAVHAMPVQFYTDVEADTGAVTVRD